MTESDMNRTDRGRYSLISRRMWNDADFRSLSAPGPNAQTLWQRLLTGPELTNMPGLFGAWEAGLAQALSWPIEDFRLCWNEISERRMAEADWRVGLIWVPNSIKHNEPANPNVVLSWNTTWSELPECDLKFKARSHLLESMKSLGDSWVKAFVKACPLPGSKGYQGTLPGMVLGNGMAKQEQEQEQIQEEETDTSPVSDVEMATIKRVFVYWTKQMNHPTAKLDKKRINRIRARLKEGFKPEELASAIRGAKKDDFLMGKGPNAKKKYDGIHTILRDAEKVEELMVIDGQKRGGSGEIFTQDPEAAKAKAAETAAIYERKKARDLEENAKLAEAKQENVGSIGDLLKMVK